MVVFLLVCVDCFIGMFFVYWSELVIGILTTTKLLSVYIFNI
jgi:hypothetical protein